MSQSFVKIVKARFWVSVFCIILVSIQCRGDSPSVVSTPPSFNPICTNGVASTKKVSTKDTEECASCNNGFGLDGELCRAQFDPICTDGVASMVKVFVASTEKCVSCNNGFGLDGELCGVFDPICPNGVASMVKVSTANTEKCVSCNSFYALKNDKTCAPILVSTLAGTGTAGFMDDMDGASGVAQFKTPRGVAVDGSGFVYVADSSNNRIRKITPGGVVSTFAGTGTAGFEEGAGTVAQFRTPFGVAVDGSSGNVYVADYSNHCIRKITPRGVVSTFAGTVTAGTGTAGFEEGAGTVARFNFPDGVAVDGSGNVYVADTFNHRIRKITPGGVVSTLAGGGTTGTPCPGTTGTTVTCRDGTGNIAQFNFPFGVAVDSIGNVYVADTNNHRIRKITPVGVVSTFAGTGTGGFMEGAGTVAQFDGPVGVAVDGSGNVYVADTNNHRIRKITPGGVVSTFAGTGTAGFEEGAGNEAQFSEPRGVAVDKSGNVYVAASSNHRIRKITIPQ